MFHRHNYVTITNLEGEAQNNWKRGKKVRSIQECTICGKRKRNSHFDNSCHTTNFRNEI